MGTRAGKFLISPDRSVVGELQIAGPQSSLVLRDDGFFLVGSPPNLTLTGTLYDQNNITLIDCVQIGPITHFAADGRIKSHSVPLFPHFIAEGGAHLEPDKPGIREISFTFEDVAALFYDFDAFGSVIDAGPYIDSIVKANAESFHRQIHTGPKPVIAYFAGQHLIVEADTALGKIRVEHCPSWPIGGPRGVRIDNEIWVSIIPKSPVTFGTAVDRLMSLLRFVAVAAGRKQNLRQFMVDAGSQDAPQPFQVHWSDYPRRLEEVTGERGMPQPADLPLDPIRHPDEFVTVLRSWLDVDEDRHMARARIHESLANQNRYTVDRLVASANAFDLLPESAVPKRVELTSEVIAAKKQCKAMFRALPESDERESLLRALGRLGEASLKQKVRHRAKLITSVAGDRFPQLDWVCDQAIECRNHFVHGSSLKIELEPPSMNQGFLTDTLEFVFAASELIESGWNIKRFLNTPTSMSHPFGAYRVRYTESLSALRATAKKPSTGDPDDS